VIVQTLDYSKTNFDKNDDCMIENEGFPDQTYDVWSATGCSAYCGGLWVAALKAARWIACELQDIDNFVYFTKLYKNARQIYLTLWNGQYYNYDQSNSYHNNSIQSDQMAGNWYSVSCGLGPIVPFEQARSCMSTIYKYNVLGFQNGQLGAVNGVRPDGTPDTTCLQSYEVWTGVTFAVAAAMLQVGLKDEAFNTLQGMIDTAYNKWGYIYDTPEAWTVDGKYRSKGYMRPLSVWAIQWVLENKEFLAEDEFDEQLEKEINRKMKITSDEENIDKNNDDSH